MDESAKVVELAFNRSLHAPDEGNVPITRELQQLRASCALVVSALSVHTSACLSS